MFSHSGFWDSGNVSLSETAANFSIFIIEFCSNDNAYGSVVLHNPNGKRIALTNTVLSAANDTVYIKSKQYIISGTSMTRLMTDGIYRCNGQGYFTVNGQGVNSGGGYIGLTQVTGIK